jgi:predicted polyphosphate/ATP-dependent NAD kinase
MLKMLLAYKQFYEVFVVAFPGGRGTKNMVEQATAANIPVIGHWEKS